MVKGLLTLLLAADTKGFNQKLTASQKRLQAFGKVTNIVKGAIIALGAAAVIALGRNALQTIIRFDKAMVGLSAILGGTRKQMKALEDQAVALGGATIFTATQIAELQTILARFGFDKNEILGATEGITNLAAAAGIDLAQAADTGAATLRAFGLEATEMNHVADVMTNAFTKSALSVETFADAMTYAAPIAASTGVTLEETAAALAILADNGIRGSIAGTGLRRILVALGGEGKTIADIMANAAAEMELAGDATAYAKDQVGLFAIAPFLTLARNAGKIGGLTKEMDEFDTAAKVATQQLTSIANKVLLMESAWEKFVISVENGEGAIGRVFGLILDASTRALELMAAESASSGGEFGGSGLNGNDIVNITKASRAVGQLDYSALAKGGVAFSGFAESVTITGDQMEELNAHFTEYLRLVEGGEEAQTRTSKTFADNVAAQQAIVDNAKNYYKNINAAKTAQDEADQILYDKDQKRLKTAYDRQEKRLLRIKYLYDEIANVYSQIVLPPIAAIEAQSQSITDVQVGEPQEVGEIQTATAGFQELNKYTDDLLTVTQTLEEAYKTLGTTLANVLSQGANSWAEYADNAGRSILKIVQDLTMLALTAAVANATESSLLAGPLGLIILPAALGLAFGLVNTALNSAKKPQAFAQGGIISGPTYGLMGEYASAGRDPEVVAPLSKLKGMMGDSGGTQVYGEFVLKNRTLVAAVNTENNRRDKYGG
jgi:hypothetical protein